jgi:hypothetical protein
VVSPVFASARFKCWVVGSPILDVGVPSRVLPQHLEEILSAVRPIATCADTHYPPLEARDCNSALGKMQRFVGCAYVRSQLVVYEIRQCSDQKRNRNQINPELTAMKSLIVLTSYGAARNGPRAGIWNSGFRPRPNCWRRGRSPGPGGAWANEGHMSGKQGNANKRL